MTLQSKRLTSWRQGWPWSVCRARVARWIGRRGSERSEGRGRGREERADERRLAYAVQGKSADSSADREALVVEMEVVSVVSVVLVTAVRPMVQVQVAGAKSHRSDFPPCPCPRRRLLLVPSSALTRHRHHIANRLCSLQHAHDQPRHRPIATASLSAQVLDAAPVRLTTHHHRQPRHRARASTSTSTSQLPGTRNIYLAVPLGPITALSVQSRLSTVIVPTVLPTPSLLHHPCLATNMAASSKQTTQRQSRPCHGQRTFPCASAWLPVHTRPTGQEAKLFPFLRDGSYDAKSQALKRQLHCLFLFSMRQGPPSRT